MKEFLCSTTKSTATAKIKQFFSHFLFVCSFFLFFFPYLLMENLRSRFEAPYDQESCDLESFEDFKDASVKWEENPDVDCVIKNEKQRLKSSHAPPELGSERKEREWRRTLECKIYQERHNAGVIAGAGEGMDVLWEVYEKTEEEEGKQGKVSEVKVNTKTRILDYLEEEEEEEELEDSNLCCLKALRFSAGMTKPGMLNLSKAFKGIKPGWLKHHHYRRRKSEKKV